MTYTPYVYLYSGATCEDVYAEQDDRQDLDLEQLAAPKCGFVALTYSDELVRELATEMWESIEEFYQDGDEDEPGLFPVTLDSLRVVTSASVCEHTGPRSRKEGFEGPLPVKEVTVLDYYHPTYNTIEPLMKIVVQVRRTRSA